MSARDDFYAPRRGEITDTGAYAGFLLGFFGAAPLGWRALTASFEDTGDATMGVIRFAGTLVVAGLATGVAGYVLGALGGKVWELRHRAANPRVKPEAGPDMATLTAAPPEATVAAVAAAWQRQARAAAPPSEPQLAHFDAPDAVREFAHGRIELVRSSGTVIGRLTCEPGWRWSRDIGAMLSREHHASALGGVILEGAMTAEFADGVARTLVAGTVFQLPALPHDLAVAGTARVVAVLFGGAEALVPGSTTQGA